MGGLVQYIENAIRKEEAELEKVKLIRRDSSVPSETLYLEVSINQAGAKPMMGIFIPQNYVATGTVNLILYFHGNKVYSENGGRFAHSDYAIDQIWSHPTFHIREDLNKSGRQLILVAPTMGAKDEYGDLANNASRYINQVMTGLHKFGPHKKLKDTPFVGEIILAGHSGGGKPMLDVAENLGYKVKEVWGFDTMYNDVEGRWLHYAQAKGIRMYFYYVETQWRSVTVAGATSRLNNVFIIKGASAHDYLVKTHLPERLQRAGATAPDMNDLKAQEASRQAAEEREHPKSKPKPAPKLKRQ